MSALLSWPTRLLLTVFAAIVCIFLLCPILIVVATSFTAYDYIAFPPGPLSLRWYGAVLSNREFMLSLLVSFEVALAASAISLAFGTAAAVALSRSHAPGLGMIRALILSPLALPGLVIAVAILEAISSVRIRPTLWTVVAGHILITLPYVVRLVTAALQNFDRNIERAALNLGDTRLGAFMHVTVPNILPGMLGGALLAFIVSFEDVNVALFLSSANATTLPVRIFNLLTQESSPIASAAGSLLTMIVLVLAFLADRLFGLERAVS